MVNLGTLLKQACYTVGGIAAIAVALLYILQEKLIYIPKLPGVPAELAYFPDQFGMAFEDVWLTTKDGKRLHAWLMWPGRWGADVAALRRRRPTVMFFQENAGNMSFRLPFLRPLTRHLDCSAFILSYRGYGLSQGSPTEWGLKLDAEAAMEHVLGRNDIDTDQVFVFGRSLGGAVAVHAAARYQDQIAGLVLENTFTSIADTAGAVLPLLGVLIGPRRPGNWLLRNRWETRREIKLCASLPVLLLSSLQDEMLPPYQMRELYDVHPSPPWRLVVFPNGRHLDAYDTEASEYWPALQQFVARHAGDGSAVGEARGAAAAAAA